MQLSPQNMFCTSAMEKAEKDIRKKENGSATVQDSFDLQYSVTVLLKGLITTWFSQPFLLFHDLWTYFL